MTMRPKYHPPRPSARRHAATAVALVLSLGLALGMGSVAAYASDEGVFHLLPGLELHVGDQGEISLVSQGSSQALVELGATDGSRRNGVGIPDLGAAFTALTAEGAAHGLRGFSSGADDDGDGLVDEDRLDGRDNDGDGRVDEDFAAIGDRMYVWDREEPSGSVHAEFYHWFYDFLKSTVFLELDSGPARTFAFRSPLPWIPVDVASRPLRTGDESGIRRTHAWVSIVRDDHGRETWLGLKSLDAGARLESIDLGELIIRTGDRPAALALAAAATWDQLCSALCASGDVRRGVRDPVTGRTVPWIVGPAESLVSQDESTSWTWRAGPGDGGELSLEAPRGIGRIPDLATLKLDGRPLPRPETVGFVTAGVEKTALVAPEFRYQDLLRGRPTPTPLWEALPDLAPRGAAGKLVLHYPSPPLDLRSAAPGNELTLEGRGLDGGRLHDAVTVGEPLVDSAVAGAREGGTDPSRELALSPDLMLGWPNPFQDHIQIRCRIPATPQEAFASDESGSDPFDADKTVMPLPWGSGEPSVSVRIYSINGQELKTLFVGRQGAGEFVVQWDGSDNFGRPVASGPYLCKLQMDDLNLTRRFIYLR